MHLVQGGDGRISSESKDKGGFMVPNFILSPCGTSLLTGGANNEQRKLLTDYAKCMAILMEMFMWWIELESICDLIR